MHHFLTGTFSQSAPEYIKKAATIIDYVNLSKEEQTVTDALEKASATYDAQLLYAEEKGIGQGHEQGLDDFAKLINDKEYRKARMKEFGIR